MSRVMIGMPNKSSELSNIPSLKSSIVSPTFGGILEPIDIQKYSNTIIESHEAENSVLDTNLDTERPLNNSHDFDKNFEFERRNTVGMS